MSEKDVCDSADILWGVASGGLSLGVSVTNSVVGLHLRNIGGFPLEVLSHVSTHEKHLDWFTLELIDAFGVQRQIVLLDTRDRSVAIRVNLQPGECLEHFVDVRQWAGRLINGAADIATGSYQVFARYAVSGEEHCWQGHLEAGPVNMLI